VNVADRDATLGYQWLKIKGFGCKQSVIMTVSVLVVRFALVRDILKKALGAKVEWHADRIRFLERKVA